jgi:outer membrane biosynthesis protein TonB
MIAKRTLLMFIACTLILSGAATFAQRISDLPDSPDSYFNNSAFLYTDEKTDLALENVEEGLQKYPNNIKLIKLKELLEKQQQQEQQQQNEQNQDQQDQQDQKQDNQQNQDQQQAQKDKQDQNKDQQDKDKQDQQDQQQQDQQQQDQQQAQPKSAEEMTAEEAKMLLDAMRNEEKAQREAMRIIMGEPEPPQNGKDW